MNDKAAQNNYNDLKDMNTIVLTYEEVAAIRMQRIRSVVLQKRSFVEELEHVYSIVRRMYKNDIMNLLKKKRISDTRILNRKNGKTIAVFIGANTGLYGDIVRRTFEYFYNDVKDHPDYDLAIVGRMGKVLAEEYNMTQNIQYIDLSDQAIQKEELNGLILTLLQYENVILYHGEFKNMLHQEAIASRFEEASSQPSTDENMPGSIPPKKDKWLIDPSLEELLNFFESELFSSFVVQTFGEGQLAKLASRIDTLEQATEHIQTEVQHAATKLEQLNHEISNKKQNDMLSGMMIWNIQ